MMRRLFLVGMLLSALVVGSCERIAPIRTLPGWVHGIYVPMITNKTYEPAIEEYATRLTQEAFLADGRLDVVPKKDADLTLRAEILQWETMTTGTTGDHIADRQDVRLVASLKLYDPFDEETPLADLGLIVVSSNNQTDTRSIYFDPEPDRKHAILEQLAQRIVYQTIDGFPLELRNLPEGIVLPEIQRPESVEENKVYQPRSSEDLD